MLFEKEIFCSNFVLRENKILCFLWIFGKGSALARGQSWFFHFPAPPDGPGGVLRPDGTSNPRSERWAYSRASSHFNVPGNPKPHSIVLVHLTPSVLLGMYERSHMARCWQKCCFTAVILVGVLWFFGMRPERKDKEIVCAWVGRASGSSRVRPTSARLQEADVAVRQCWMARQGQGEVEPLAKDRHQRLKGSDSSS